MREQLRRFTDFADLDARAAAAVAAAARRLRVPARRWLVRPGRSLPGRFYLLEGRVRLVQGDRSVIVSAGSARARRMVYPGAAGVETLTLALFLNVPVCDWLDQSDPAAGLAVPEVSTEEASWQRRFLSSPVMQRLDPVTWQRVLRAMRRSRFDAGEPIIRAGEGADCCYVLCSGRAEIRGPAGRLLAGLAPGSLFGEDALISGAVRNADVVMAAAGEVVSLEACRFRSWLLDEVVQPVTAPARRVVIDLDPGGSGIHVPLASLRQAAAQLSPAERYAIAGGTEAERTLAAFLLAEQGIDARPLRGRSPLMPARSDPAPSV